MRIEIVEKYSGDTGVFRSGRPAVSQRVGGELIVSGAPTPDDPNYQRFSRNGGIKGAFQAGVCERCNVFDNCKRNFAGCGGSAQRVYFEAVADGIGEKDAKCLKTSSF